MTLQLILFTLIISIIFALLEIQIEGGDGWAKNLPTWRIKNPFKKIITWPYLTGYHFYLNLFLLFLLQLPFFVGFTLSLKNEILILEIYFVVVFLEDFFWFVFNPKWGIKRFFNEEIPWHEKKILFFPKNYWIGFFVITVLEIAKKLLFS